MNEGPLAFPNQKLSTLLINNAQRYQELVAFFDDYQFEVEETNTRLLDLGQVLLESYELLNKVFTEDVSASKLLPYFDWLEEGKDEFYQMYGGIKMIEKILLHLMEIIEEEFEGNSDEEFRSSVTALFDLLEEISDALVSMKPIASSLKNLFDTAIEFNDIFKDHMNGLDQEIEANLKKCILLQEETFTSPVRHNKLTFTLDQLVKILSSTNSPTKGLQIPIFTPLEQKIYEQLTSIEASVGTIDLSLKSVLSDRIDNYENRDVVNLQYLLRLLRKKHQHILDKYSFLQHELHDLNHLIVDQKWRSIFSNLNDELRAMLLDVEKLSTKILNQEFSEDIKTKFVGQLRRKSTTIDRTFNIIYKAIEMSILDEETARETNEYAEKWLHMKSKDKNLLRLENFDINEGLENDVARSSRSSIVDTTVSKLSSDISDLKLNDAPSEKPGSNRSSIGAILSKKMNIKPVLVKEEDEDKLLSRFSSSNEYSNPFYAPSESSHTSYSKVLNLNTVPSLSFDDRNGLKTSPKNVILYDHQRLREYGTVPTRIPCVNREIDKPVHRTVLFTLAPNWTKDAHHTLRQPNYSITGIL